MKRIISFILVFVLLLSLCACGAAPAEPTTVPTETQAAAPKSLKVLAIGNSFSVDAMTYLYQVAMAEGVEEVILGNFFVGACTLKMHAGYMESGEAAVGAYYAGDYFTMKNAQAENVDLQFYYPDNTNYYIDAMCIPACCQNQELAERFINFMLSEEAAIANAEYTYYASPNQLVYTNEGYIENMGEEAMEILYRNADGFREAYNKNAYRNLPAETLSYINTLWETVKIN